MEETFTKAIDILYLAKQNGVDILLNGDRLQLKIPEDKTIDNNLLEQIRANKQTIIDYLSNDSLRSAVVDKSNEITPFNRDVVKHIPLSFSQERLWFIDRLEGSTQYHIPAVLRLKGIVDREALQMTLLTIIGRHEVLRTVIVEHEGQGYQQVMPVGDWTLNVTENLTEDKAVLSSFVEDLINKPFDLSKDYMLRADLIKVAGRSTC